MGLAKENKLSVWINGHDLTSSLVSFRARVRVFDVEIDLEYLDVDNVNFEPMTPCARRDKVELSVRVGARDPVALKGIIECAVRKEIGEAHPVSINFKGELAR